MAYGKELIMDLYGCNPKKFNRSNLDKFFAELCELIDMEKCERYFWDDLGIPESERQISPHTKGTSAVQFILTSITSNITIHTLDMVGEVYINVFSCKDFDAIIAIDFITKWFEAMAWDEETIIRGRKTEA